MRSLKARIHYSQSYSFVIVLKIITSLFIHRCIALIIFSMNDLIVFLIIYFEIKKSLTKRTIVIFIILGGITTIYVNKHLLTSNKNTAFPRGIKTMQLKYLYQFVCD